MGLIGKVVPHDAFEEHVEWAVDQIKLTGPKARAMLKADINRRLPEPDINMFRQSIMSPELMEGLKAFLEKRPARWPRG